MDTDKVKEGAAFSITGALYRAIAKLLKGTETSLKSFVVSLLVVAMEQFFSNIIFRCPEKNYVAYGVLFLVGPFVILFCISMQVSKSFWALTTGCCRVPCQRQRAIWVRASSSLFLATLPPLLWLVFAFADKEFYVCAKLGSKEIAKENKTDTEKVDIDKKFNQAKSESQIIAWALFIAFTVFFTIVISVRRFCMKDRAFQGGEDFEKYEGEEAVSYFNGKLRPAAEKEAKKFVDDLMEKYKDEDPASRVSMCEKELEKRYPYHSGVVAGKYRVSGTGTKFATTASKKRHEETILLHS